MIEVLKKIWQFAGDEQQNIRTSSFGSFIFAVFHMLQVAAIYFVILALTAHDTTNRTVWIALALILVSIAGRAVTNRFTQLQQTHAGYFMVANRRVAIGDKLKRVPMGYFNDKSLGALTGVTTTVLEMVETQGPVVLVNMMSGFITSVVFVLCLLAFDWRIVIKSFNLTGKGDGRVRATLTESARANLAIEKSLCPYIALQEIVLHLFSVAMIACAVWFYLAGTLGLADALMTVVVAFMVFSQIQSAGSAVAGLRLVASSIDQADEVDEIPEMDDGARAFEPQDHTIVFDHVDFAYENKPVLRDVSLTIPDRSTCAIVGPSGSGKTTLCHLIARFWDVESGSITIGGHDVRAYILESLMNQISMVFQNVYLFADTIENNIRFGKPNASREEVVRAARAACCHDFIMQLPQGYDTVIGEGGATLSGGERQRISIARAILKDAPIIILDEATSSVDPENEAELQAAFAALAHGKTVIMIAHQLNTVRHADQILVLDNAHIVQRGTHAELIQQKGLYADFVSARQAAIGWKLAESKEEK